MMTPRPQYPKLRDDLEILAQASPGRPDRHVLKDPVTGSVMELGAMDMALCRLMDGLSDLPAIRETFQARQGKTIRPEHLAAFVRQLGDAGLLVGTRLKDTRWHDLHRVWLINDKTFAFLARRFGWCFHRFTSVPLALLTIVMVGILAGHWSALWYEFTHLFASIENVGLQGSLPVQSILRIAMVLVLFPFISEIAKGVACRHYGFQVPEVRFAWFMRFIPRCAADITAVTRIPEKGRQLSVAKAGLATQWTLMALAVILFEVLSRENPMKSFFFSFSLGSALAFLMNVVPLGEQDGSLWLALKRDIPDYRHRAVGLFRSWLWREPAPEAIADAERACFIRYGLWADLYAVVINVAVMALAGYLLVTWLNGLGAVLFLCLVVLRFETDLRNWASSWGPTKWLHMKLWKNPTIRHWVVLPVVLLVLVLLFFIPYPREVSGPFRVQPQEKREVRTQVQGWIEELLVSEGAHVDANQPLVQLSKQNLQREYDGTEASLLREKAHLKKYEEGARPEEVQVARQHVTLARTVYEHSERALVRARELYEKKHISDQDYDNAVKQRDVDRETLELANRELTLLESGTREEDLEAQRAEVQRLAGDLKHLAENLAETRIVSPISGSITTLYLDGMLGQQVNVGDVVAIVEDNSRVLVRIAMPEEYTGVVHVGARVRVKPWAYPDQILKGEVKSVTAVVIDRTEDILKQAHVEQEGGMVRNLSQPEDHVVMVLAELPNEKGFLKSDMTGYAKIEADTRPLGLVLLDPIIRFFRVQVWSWIP